jgi:hypothetical protein
MCELATRTPSLASKALDFLVEMFNDEIDAVPPAEEEIKVQIHL